MKSWGKLVVVVLLVALFGGCVRVASLVELNADGSGTLFLRYLLSEELDKNQEAPALDGEKLLAKLGEGVEFVETKRISKKGWRGYQAEFKFTDINKLRIPFNEEDPLSLKDEKKKKSNNELPILSMKERGAYRFDYQAGSPNELVVYHEVKKANDAEDTDPFAKAGLDLTKPPAVDLSTALEGPLLRMVLQGVRISSLVKVDGEIIETNAVEKPTAKSVILMDLDMSKFATSKMFDQAMTQRWNVERLIKEKAPGISALPAAEKVKIRFR